MRTSPATPSASRAKPPGKYGSGAGRRYHGEPHQAAIVALVAAEAGHTLVPPSLGPAPAGTAVVPLASGAAGAFDWQAVTRTGEVSGGADPLAAAFLPCLREARPEERDRAARDHRPGREAEPATPSA